MKRILLPEKLNAIKRQLLGGKGFALARLIQAGVRVPTTAIVPASVYQEFIASHGLRERIQLELNRKKFADMRWEEIWDASLRIRNLFVLPPLAGKLANELEKELSAIFGDNSVVVRSSASDEDSSGASFAGLHESYVNIRGVSAVMEHIKLVWASLWSDAALLYRQEIGLSLEQSAMAVVVQELIEGDSSGVAFSVDPTDDSRAVVEAVHGLNQGLVDGVVEPDRWIVARSSGTLLEHRSPERRQYMRADNSGVHLYTLPAKQRERPPLTGQEVTSVMAYAYKLEKFFGSPQDIEWTSRAGKIYILQARPITTLDNEKKGDKRPWYLSLRRNIDNLRALQKKIEDDLLPTMQNIAKVLAAREFNNLTDQQLADEIEQRRAEKEKWLNVYWSDFIPFAHGMRLFGQVYNDRIKPKNPYAFVDLLSQAPLISLQRNTMLEKLAGMVRENPSLRLDLQDGDISDLADKNFRILLKDFLETFGDLSCPVTGGRECFGGTLPLVRIILNMAAQAVAEKREKPPGDQIDLEEEFLECYDSEKAREEARELLSIARASYRLRDDDNIILGRIEAEYLRAVREGVARLEGRGFDQSLDLPGDEVIVALRDNGYIPKTVKPGATKKRLDNFSVKARQLVGQPAGPGIGRGRARVVEEFDKLADFQHGEVLVCDAVDPNMTFIVPLAAAIVERRGGMLIHGAIIAREYGIACVTGVAGVTELIRTGDNLTVDGFLGIVTVEERMADG